MTTLFSHRLRRGSRIVRGRAWPYVTIGLVLLLLIGGPSYLVTTVWLWTLASSSLSQHNNYYNRTHPSPLPAGQQYVRTNKRGKIVMHRIERVRIQDLTDLTDDALLEHVAHHNQNADNATAWQEATAGKQVLLDELYQSGIRDMDLATVQLLPTWKEVVQLYYPHLEMDKQTDKSCQPIIWGLNHCRAFAQRYPRRQRFLATAGLYNTGTNALTYYLRANLQMPHNPLWKGMLVQVPWHKHWFAHLRHSHVVPHLANLTTAAVLPIVTIRDPLSWAQSMCRQPYDVVWTSATTGETSSTAPAHCPSRRVDGDPSIRLPLQTGNQSYRDLFDLWNQWYRGYLEAAQQQSLPVVMVRHEDLLYCPRQVLTQLQACSGAQWTHPGGNGSVAASSSSSFVYVMDQAKWEHARETGRAQSSRVSAMIKHGHAAGRRVRHLTATDFDNHGIVNQTLLDLFGYRLPPGW